MIALSLRPWPYEPPAVKPRKVPVWAHWAVYRLRDGEAILCGFTDTLERAERMLEALGGDSMAEEC